MISIHLASNRPTRLHFRRTSKRNYSLPAVIDDLDDILNVPELGFVFIAPSTSLALGPQSEIDHPDVQEAVGMVREAAVDAGVPVGERLMIL